MRKENLLILEWKTFIISVNEIIGRVDKIKTGNLLKRLTIKEGYSEDIFVEEERVRIKKQQPRLIKIKTMKQTEASVSKIPYQQEDF